MIYIKMCLPCSLSSVIVEPYNALLATHFSMDYTDVTFIVDNEALYDICANKLDVPAPTYTNLNRLIGQVSFSKPTPQIRLWQLF